MIISDNKKASVVIISEYFAPSTGATAQLITDLALGLAQRGHKIRVLTATSGYSVEGIEVIRLTNSTINHIGVIQKAVNGVKFVIGVILWSSRNVKREQRLLIVSNPPFLGLAGKILRVTIGCDYIFLFQDLFPRSAALTGVLPATGPITGFWRYLMKEVCKSSLATIVLSEAMKKRCLLEAQSELPLCVIHNWAVEQALAVPKESNYLARKWGVDKYFTVQYSGNFGRLHELLTILEAARITDEDKIKFLFIGGGAKKRQIDVYKRIFNLDNVIIMPYQDRKVLPLSLGACDMSAIGLIPGAEDTVTPSKFYGILASGRGVILVAQRHCDLAKLVEKESCGIVVEPGDVLELAEQLRIISSDKERVMHYGNSAKKLYEREFGFSRSLTAYENLLTQKRNDTCSRI